MFSSVSKRTEPTGFSLPVSDAFSAAPPQGATIIARGVKLEGDFDSKGDVVIDGEVRGKVTASGKLTVGSEAVIHADVSANDAVIGGLVEGNVTVKGQVMVHATARIVGDLTAERLAMEFGATLDGRVRIGASTPESLSTSAATPEPVSESVTPAPVAETPSA